MLLVHVTDRDGTERDLEAEVGQSLLDLGRHYDLAMEGTCGGQMACATCHCVIAPEYASRLPAPTEEEQEMLEFARGVGSQSRLGCQVRLTAEVNGLRFRVIGE